MKRIKVKSFLMDAKKTGSIPAVRGKMIDNAPDTDIPGTYPVNILANTLHPKNFPLKIKYCEVNDTYVYAELVSEKAEPFWFKGGQFLGVKYISDTLERFSALPVLSASGDNTVKVAFVREYDENAYSFFEKKESLVLDGVSFEGHMNYSGIRDKKSAVILTDRYAFAAALSLAKTAVKTYGDVDIKIYFECGDALLYEFVCTHSDAIQIKEFSEDSIFEGEDITLFIAGCVEFCDKYADYFKKRYRNIRCHPVNTVREYDGGMNHTVKVLYRGDTFDTICREGERLSTALMRAGIPADIRCSDGECGYCRCRLLSGETNSLICTGDKRTGADVKYGYIHPCSVTPASDISVEL